MPIAVVALRSCITQTLRGVEIGEGASQVALSFAGGSQFKAESANTSPITVHTVTIDDKSLVGSGAPHNLANDQSASVLAIACTLLRPDVLFSTAHPGTLASLFENDLQPVSPPIHTQTMDVPPDGTTQVAMGATEHVGMCVIYKKITSMAVELDEAQIAVFLPSCLQLSHSSWTGAACQTQR